MRHFIFLFKTVKTERGGAGKQYDLRNLQVLPARLNVGVSYKKKLASRFQIAVTLSRIYHTSILYDAHFKRKSLEV